MGSKASSLGSLRSATPTPVPRSLERVAVVPLARRSLLGSRSEVALWPLRPCPTSRPIHSPCSCDWYVRKDAELLCTDELKSYAYAAVGYRHATVNHSETFVNGNVHVMGVEPF